MARRPLGVWAVRSIEAIVAAPQLTFFSATRLPSADLITCG